MAATDASDVTTSGAVTCVGRSENRPSPSGGSTAAIASRRPTDSPSRRPSGLSDGTADSRGIRTTTVSPAATPSAAASG